MKKTMCIVGELMAAAFVGMATYVLIDKQRRLKAESMICDALDEAGDMLNRTMN